MIASRPLHLFYSHGEPLVKACVAKGTHYCDITGETPFVRYNINKYHEEAEKKVLDSILVIIASGG